LGPSQLVGTLVGIRYLLQHHLIHTLVAIASIQRLRWVPGTGIKVRPTRENVGNIPISLNTGCILRAIEVIEHPKAFVKVELSMRLETLELEKERSSPRSRYVGPRPC
jgi:hypothetical protein